MTVEVIFWSLLAILFIAVLATFISKKEKYVELQHFEAENRVSAQEKRQRILDHQLTHSQKVLSWLKKELAQYADDGMRIRTLEYNRGPEEDTGGNFSIFIEREDAGSMQGHIPILQLNYDFVSRPAPYFGHIHYGSYGPDILFWVGAHSPLNGLDSLVLKVVREEAERLRDGRLQRV